MAIALQRLTFTRRLVNGAESGDGREWKVSIAARRRIRIAVNRNLIMDPRGERPHTVSTLQLSSSWDVDDIFTLSMIDTRKNKSLRMNIFKIFKGNYFDSC